MIKDSDNDSLRVCQYLLKTIHVINGLGYIKLMTIAALTSRINTDKL